MWYMEQAMPWHSCMSTIAGINSNDTAAINPWQCVDTCRVLLLEDDCCMGVVTAAVIG